MSQSCSLNKLHSHEYSVVSPVEEKTLWFRALHVVAPLLKLTSIGLTLFALIRNYYIFILAALLWAGSIAINYLKWKLNYAYEVRVDRDRFFLIRRYQVIKDVVLADIPITDIDSCDIILPDEISCENERYFSLKILPEILLKLKVKSHGGKIYCVGADRYFYSLLMDKMGELKQKHTEESVDLSR